MSTFRREFNDDLIKSLKQTKLFEKLKLDIEKGKVFPAIRHNTIQFYYMGSRVFIFDKNGFSTHYKYLMNNSKAGNNYITNNGEQEIDNSCLIVNNFYDGYESIKRNISINAKPEATLTSGFYAKSFFNPSVRDNYYLLDIEAAFKDREGVLLDCEDGEDKKRKGMDRIDAVFFDKSKGKIVFCEVKRFDDPRIYEKNGTIEVIDQLERYKNRIDKNRSEIINAYKHAMNIYRELFGTEIFEIKDIYSQAWLFVTGCPDIVYKNGVDKTVAKIESDGWKIYFEKAASGTALVTMCKKSK